MNHLNKTFIVVFYLLLIVFLLLLWGCQQEGSSVKEHVYENDKSETYEQLNVLRDKINALELFTGTYSTEDINPFENCDTLTTPLEKKVCQIAQSANSSQQFEIKTQLSTIAKEFQTAIYGDDCSEQVSTGCPNQGSLLGRMNKIENDLQSTSSSVGVVLAKVYEISNDVNGLSTRLGILESRLNNFNGTPQSIEDIISGIDGDIVSIKNDINVINGTIQSNRILMYTPLCFDNKDSGPVYEPILIAGDKSSAYRRSGSGVGVTKTFSAGDPPVGFWTTLNTKKCRFRFYSNTTGTKLQVCWLNSDRLAADSLIDSSRTLGSATCTPW